LDRTVNFTTAFSSVNYSYQVTGLGDAGNIVGIGYVPNGATKTTTALQVRVANTANALFDRPEVNVDHPATYPPKRTYKG
jgi:hypothetical protein